MSPWLRRALLLTMDLLALLAAGVATLALREGSARMAAALSLQGGRLLAGATLFIALAGLFGLYRRLWEYASVRDLLAVVGACLAAGVALATVADIPAADRMLFWLLASGGLAGGRLTLRVWRELCGRTPAPVRRRVLIAGAGEAGVELARELVRHPEMGLEPVGFVDDDAAKQGQAAHGLRVAGPCRDLTRAARRLGADEVIIAMPSAPGPAVRELLTQSAAGQLPVRILPVRRDGRHGRGLAGQVRTIELADLLGRGEVRLDRRSISQFLTGRVVLVTGAGGSIGSELSRQVAATRPELLVLMGHGEHSLFQIQTELQDRYPHVAIQPLIGDVQDRQRMDQVCQRTRPAVVFHAAAHKHVPLMELNPGEALKNNVAGTCHLALAARHWDVERFVLVSTDKAVHPTSVMGATKWTAERAILSLASTSRTAFIIVRFGNVLGSRGSVVPLFQAQIARGGPVTVTHPEATRYFMTIPEAASLILQAAAMGAGGDLFLLDMGEPVRILDVARDLIRLSGLPPDAHIPIQFTGLRAGEKLTEELFTAAESLAATRHQRVFRVRAQRSPPLDLNRVLTRCQALAAAADVSAEQILALVNQAEEGADADGPGP